MGKFSDIEFTGALGDFSKLSKEIFFEIYKILVSCTLFD